MCSRSQKESSAFREPFLPDVVAQCVAPVPPAAEAHSLVEGVDVVAPVCCALLIVVKQRVDEQMD